MHRLPPRGPRRLDPRSQFHCSWPLDPCWFWRTVPGRRNVGVGRATGPTQRIDVSRFWMMIKKKKHDPRSLMFIFFLLRGMETKQIYNFWILLMFLFDWWELEIQSSIVLGIPGRQSNLAGKPPINGGLSGKIICKWWMFNCRAWVPQGIMGYYLLTSNLSPRYPQIII